MVSQKQKKKNFLILLSFFCFSNIRNKFLHNYSKRSWSVQKSQTEWLPFLITSVKKMHILFYSIKFCPSFAFSNLRIKSKSKNAKQRPKTLLEKKKKQESILSSLWGWQSDRKNKKKKLAKPALWLRLYKYRIEFKKRIVV